MRKLIYSLLVPLLFLSGASLAFASVTLNSVTLNGVTGPIQVQPGDNINVVLTATLTDGSKWKGIDWGISNNGSFDTCVNTKNAKDGTRNNSTGVFTETFTIKAPATPGLYSTVFLGDLSNNCGTTVSPALTLAQSVQVGSAVHYTIDPHDGISVSGTSPGAIVQYTNPVVRDQSNNVVGISSCTPASGSVFPVGDTIVTCTYPNATNSPFTVSVIPPRTLVTMASQNIDSNFCDFVFCFTGPASSSPQATINLGLGSNMGTAALQSVSIERDPQFSFFPWTIKIACFTDAGYTNACPDWVANTNGNGNGFVQEGTVASSTNTKISTAFFTNERGFDGASPVIFNPSYYYQLIIFDNLNDLSVYGSPSGIPYYVITGITQ